MLKVFLSLTLIVACCHAYHVDTDSKLIVDDLGRSRIFHGVNAVVKIPPFVPSTKSFTYDMSLNDQDIAYMKKWGMNVVRLGVMWVAVEPVKGQYNTTYLESVRELTDTLGKNDISVIIDMHQDVFARKYCGEGFPTWVVDDIKASHQCSGIIGTVAHWLGICKTFDDYHFELDSQGDPLIKDCLKNMFSFYYPMTEVSSSFQAFYDSSDLQDRFAAYWKKLAETFVDAPNVLGYDFLNEPWVGDIWKDITRLIPGKVDKEVLQPMYQRINKVVRTVDDKKIVFFEPVQDDKVGILGGFIFPVGFTETPGSAEYDDRQMLNFHVYCCQKGASACKGGEPSLKEAPACAKWNHGTVKQRTNDAISLNVGSFLTEFGACFNTDACTQEIKSVTEAAESKFVSWAYWQYKAFGDYTTSGSYKEGLFNTDGTPQDKKVTALARSYAPIVAGVPTLMRYNIETNAFGLEYQCDPTIKAPTSIYLNQEYSNGQNDSYDLLLTTAKGEQVPFTKTQEGSLLNIQYTGNSAEHVLLSMTITPNFTPGQTHLDKYFISYKQASQTLSAMARITVLPGNVFADDLQLRLMDVEGNKLCTVELKGATPSQECQTPPVRLPGYTIEVYKKEFLFWVKKGEFSMGALNGYQYLININNA